MAKQLDSHLTLFHALVASRSVKENVFCSTASLQAALCTGVLAATPNSDAKKELLRLFGAEDLEIVDAIEAVRATGMTNAFADSGLVSANALFTFKEGKVRPEFKELLKAEIGAEASLATCADDINSWCARNTDGMINSIVDKVEDDVFMMIVNAVLFRGKWRHPFEGGCTHEEPWRNSSFTGAADGKIPLMTGKFNVAAGYVGAGSSRSVAVRLPYKFAASATARFEAWFVLPEAEGPEALSAVGEALNGFWGELCALEEQKVVMRCPRFTVDSGVVDCIPVLRSLGVSALFDRPRGLLTATDDPTGHISSLAHRAMCLVDEDGTVAAAVTCMGASLACCPAVYVPPLHVVLDRPFYMAIVVTLAGARAPLPVFLGRIVQPTKLSV